MVNTWKRKAPALLSVPLLAVPSAVGVYFYLAPESGELAAGLAAAGFEVLYIGVNILVIANDDLRRYARNVSLAAVAVAVIMNALAHYGLKVPGAYTGAPFAVLAAVLALVASAPLAGLAYAVSVLLHRLSEADVRRLATDVQLRAEVAQRDTQIARLRDEAAQATAAADRERAATGDQAAAAAQAEQRAHDLAAQLAQRDTRVAQQEREIARLRDEAAQATAATGYDRTAIVRALREPGAVSWREIEALLGVAQSTLRGELERAERRNGHPVAAPEE